MLEEKEEEEALSSCISDFSPDTARHTSLCTAYVMGLYSRPYFLFSFSVSFIRGYLLGL